MIEIQAETIDGARRILLKQEGCVYAIRAPLAPRYRFLVSLTFAIGGCDGRRRRLIFDELSLMEVSANLIGGAEDTARIGNPTYREIRAWKFPYRAPF